jgi:hypothetical protein
VLHGSAHEDVRKARGCVSVDIISQAWRRAGSAADVIFDIELEKKLISCQKVTSVNFGRQTSYSASREGEVV